MGFVCQRLRSGIWSRRLRHWKTWAVVAGSLEGKLVYALRSEDEARQCGDSGDLQNAENWKSSCSSGGFEWWLVHWSCKEGRAELTSYQQQRYDAFGLFRWSRRSSKTDVNRSPVWNILKLVKRTLWHTFHIVGLMTIRVMPTSTFLITKPSKSETAGSAG